MKEDLFPRRIKVLLYTFSIIEQAFNSVKGFFTGIHLRIVKTPNKYFVVQKRCLWCVWMDITNGFSDLEFAETFARNVYGKTEVIKKIIV